MLQLDLRKLQEQLSNRMEELKTSLAALDSFRAGAVKSDQVTISNCYYLVCRLVMRLQSTLFCRICIVGFDCVRDLSRC